jgi:hypothetical protein
MSNLGREIPGTTVEDQHTSTQMLLGEKTLTSGKKKSCVEATKIFFHDY